MDRWIHTKTKGEMILKKRKHSSILVVALVLLIAGASAIGGSVMMQDMELSKDAEEYESLLASIKQENYGSAAEDALLQLNPSWEAVIQDLPFVQSRTSAVDFAALQAVNSDFIAWLTIPGTKIDYPVVLSDDSDYYLNHTFTGKKSYLGTLFSLTKTDYQKPSKNIAIYGHHIRSSGEKMFRPLVYYKEQSFYQGHETIYLDSPYHIGTYTIFAVINMRKDDWNPSIANFANDTDFLNFVNQAKAQALYDTGVEVNADDYILTLITCDRSYAGKNGRLIVMAVRE